MLAAPSRCGFTLFGLAVSSSGVKPFTVGVPGLAVKGCPSALVAVGYVPK
jgi:hypothetical protein